jgi:lipopolysaccharide export LptBFGC system permease protein LptF
MVFTLHRYIFRELLKVFLPAAIALTLIISLGSILRPVQEFGIGPRRVIYLMVYFLPVALTFVLPIAALFAGALVYGRLASDNELDACKASGINLPTLIYPGLSLAIIVAIISLLLSFYVTPIFVHLAEKSLKTDAKQILFRNLQRRGHYRLPPDQKYLVYADHAEPKNDTLFGVVIIRSDEGVIKEIVTAESAKVDFNPQKKFNEVKITAYKTNQMDVENEGWFYSEWLSFRAEFGPLLGDEIRFKKIDEMKMIRADLLRFYPIAKLARQVYAQFTTELLAQNISNNIADANLPKADYELLGEPNSVKFTAEQCNVQDEKKAELFGNITVYEYQTDNKQLLHTLTATKASLYVEGDELAPTLTMDIYNARVKDSGDLRMRYVIRGLIPPESIDIRKELRTENILDAIHLASTSSILKNKPSSQLKELQDRLQWLVRQTIMRITAEMHSRLVFGLGCVPMILIGIGLGIIKKGGHMLTAFGASCVPATVLLVCISSGIQIINNLRLPAASGVILMWSGLVFLSILAIGIYLRLMKT